MNIFYYFLNDQKSLIQQNDPFKHMCNYVNIYKGKKL